MAYELYHWAYAVLEVGFSMFLTFHVWLRLTTILLNQHEDDDDDHAGCYIDSGLKPIELVCGQSSKNIIPVT